MSRPTHLTKTTKKSTKTKSIILVAAIVLLGGGAVWDITTYQTPAMPVTVSSKPAPTTQLTYHGQDGKSALELLKQHANVQTKSSSLGDYVVSINGNDGSGKKYWLFYVNGQESQVGAGAYVTHTSDTIQWKLQ